MSNGRDFYEKDLIQLRERLIRVLGMPTVDRLIERSSVEIGSAHPAAAKLRLEGGEIVFDDMRSQLENASEDEVRDTFTALVGVLVLLVARLLGRELALRLTEDLTVAELLETSLVGIY